MPPSPLRREMINHLQGGNGAQSGRDLADSTAYTVARRREGAAGGTIRKELALLGKLLGVAYANGKLMRLPTLEKPQEGPARAGFFEKEAFDAVRRLLRPDLQVAVTIAYVFGWRKGEVLGLERPTSTSTPGRCGSTRGPPRTARGGWCT